MRLIRIDRCLVTPTREVPRNVHAVPCFLIGLLFETPEKAGIRKRVHCSHQISKCYLHDQKPRFNSKAAENLIILLGVIFSIFLRPVPDILWDINR